MKKPLQIISSLVLLTLIFSFVSLKPKKVKLPKEFLNQFTFIPEGELELDQNKTKIPEFYLSKFEISNFKYAEFLKDMEALDNQDILQKIKVNGNLWEILSNSEAYSVHYHTHPAYEGYPVVNITHEAALLWCKWATEKANQEWGDDYDFTFRLPTRNEWMHAANDGRTRMKYSWGGPMLTNAKGCRLCNFNILGAENIHYNKQSGEYEIIPEQQGGAFIQNSSFDITAPVMSYAPTNSGLYNLNGNVAEMTSEDGMSVGGSWKSTGYDVRNVSIENYDSAGPTIGFRPLVIVRMK